MIQQIFTTEEDKLFTKEYTPESLIFQCVQHSMWDLLCLFEILLRLFPLHVFNQKLNSY